MRTIFFISNTALLLFGMSFPTLASTKCAFQSLQFAENSKGVWIGDCKNGKADGIGVIRIDHGNQVYSFFYGKLVDGKATIGTIEHATGFMVGKFQDGKIMETDDPQIVLESFRVGAQAAEKVSQNFASVRNTPSANYYKRKAELLWNQIE
jgi:hypothetical protein